MNIFAFLYSRFLKLFGFKEPITHTVRRLQVAEPIVFMGLALAEGLLLATFLDVGQLVLVGCAVVQGILIGHFWW